MTSLYATVTPQFTQALASPGLRVAYRDDGGVWPFVAPSLALRLPLRAIEWQNHVGATKRIDRLPLHFEPAAERDAELPLLSVFVIKCEETERYKTTLKPQIAQWIERMNAARVDWMLLYVPLGTRAKAAGSNVYKKIFDKIKADFSHKKSASSGSSAGGGSGGGSSGQGGGAMGSATVGPGATSSASANNISASGSHANGVASDRICKIEALEGASVVGVQQQHESQWTELLVKLRKCVMEAFQLRCRLYEEEARVLDVRLAIDMAMSHTAMASHSLSPLLARLYLFIRQIRALYVMGDFRQLIQRALVFIPLFHETLTQTEDADPSDAQEATLRWFHPYQWAVGACLEIAYACELSWSGHDYEVSSATVPESATLSITPESMACLLGDLLYLARRLLKRSEHTTGWWITEPATALTALSSPTTGTDNLQPSAEAHQPPATWYLALSSVFTAPTPQPFQRCVWELSHLASLHFSRAGRHRFAVYLGVECARFHAQRREFESASRLFRSHARQCEEDQWWELVSADVQRICAAELALGRAAQAVAACFSLLELAQSSKVQVRRAALDQLLSALVESLAKNEQPDDGDGGGDPAKTRGAGAKMGELITPQMSIETMQTAGSTLDYGDVRVSLSLTNRFPAGILVETISVQFSRVGTDAEIANDAAEDNGATITLTENNVYLYERASVNLIFVYGDVDVGTYACSSLECVIAGGHKFALRMASKLSALRFEIPARQSTLTLDIVGPPLLAPATMDRVRVVISSERDVVSGGRLEISVADECVDTISIHRVEIEDRADASEDAPESGDRRHSWTVAVPSMDPQQTRVCTVWLVVSDSTWDERRRATIHASFRYDEATRAKLQTELRRVERTFNVQAPFRRRCRVQRAGSNVFLGVALTCKVGCGILLKGYKLHCNGVENDFVEGTEAKGDVLALTQDLNAHLIGQRLRADETMHFAFALQHTNEQDAHTKPPSKAVLRVTLEFDCDGGVWRTDSLIDVPLDGLRGPAYEVELQPKAASTEYRRGEEVAFVITVRVSGRSSQQPAALMLAFDAAHDEADWILMGKQEEQLSLAEFECSEGSNDPENAGHERSFSTERRLLPLRVGRVPFPRFVLKEIATPAAPAPRAAASADSTPTSSFSAASASRTKSLHVQDSDGAARWAFTRVPSARVFQRQHAKALLVVFPWLSQFRFGSILTSPTSPAKMSFLVRSIAAPLRRSTLATRGFANQSLPDIFDHAVGRQKEELEAEKEGYELFNRDPLETDETMGNSKDDPIFVPSFEEQRTVGISHNDSSYITWFNLKKGKVHYVPDFGKYFMLYNPEELAQLVKEVEAKQE
ncbi:hypothetical protein P43SY_007945 [Pythium insidiosum]|uniref:TRAPPC10/Trs130 N-terminal domain-containing protein n=1 Tax=Pythium insidiosum TaxID=114742 RepID=A0AAD5LAR7_PYTIN|nr:hypothetical protein P43SY_007945 [Pythium insidiosum]